MISEIFINQGYEPQSKLRGNSTSKLQSQMTFRLCTLFLKLGSH
jgi:hypothetical protein